MVVFVKKILCNKIKIIVVVKYVINFVISNLLVTLIRKINWSAFVYFALLMLTLMLIFRLKNKIQEKNHKQRLCKYILV